MKAMFKRMDGKRLFNRYSGEMGRVSKVIARGKTSARFVIDYEGRKSLCQWEETYGELVKHHVFVEEEYRHALPSVEERLRKIVKLVDEKCGGKLQVIYKHFTELDSWVKEETRGVMVRDGMSLWRSEAHSVYEMGISIWGSGKSFDLKATTEEVRKAEGDLWRVFKPMVEKLIEDEGEGLARQARTERGGAEGNGEVGMVGGVGEVARGGAEEMRNV